MCSAGVMNPPNRPGRKANIWERQVADEFIRGDLSRTNETLLLSVYINLVG